MKRAADSIGDFMKGLYKGDLWLKNGDWLPFHFTLLILIHRPLL